MFNFNIKIIAFAESKYVDKILELKDIELHLIKCEWIKYLIYCDS